MSFESEETILDCKKIKEEMILSINKFTKSRKSSNKHINKYIGDTFTISSNTIDFLDATYYIYDKNIDRTKLKQVCGFNKNVYENALNESIKSKVEINLADHTSYYGLYMQWTLTIKDNK